MIEVRGLTEFYPPDTVALSEVTLAIPDGQFAVLIGPSGAGNSDLRGGRKVRRLSRWSGMALILGLFL